MRPASGTSTVPACFLIALNEVFEHVIVSAESERLAELLAGLTLFEQMTERHGILEQVHLVPLAMQCQVGHAIRTQVHISGNNQIHFRAGYLSRRQYQAVDLTQHLLWVTIGRALAACRHLILESTGQFQPDCGKASLLERCNRLLHFVRCT